MTDLHFQGEIIANRYQIVTTLGQGGMSVTYAAIDLNNSQKVALKASSLRQASDWKVLELFEREAKTLANLHHPYIPQYLDYFELDIDNDKGFYLVQELITGESLAQLIADNWQPTEAEVKKIAIQLLDILIYLHSLNPPVIHRDIKPQNIIRQSDGKVYLVDFGAVQAVYRNTISISGTFVGTLGYMSPEQLRGHVVPASDLYSLGCTLVFLLTKKIPTDLPQKRMKIDFQSEVNLADNFAYWLDKILEPATEKRWQSASVALEQLQYDSSKDPYLTNIKRSQFSNITIFKKPQNLCLEILSQGINISHFIVIFVGAIFTLVGGIGFFLGEAYFLLAHLTMGILALGGGINSVWYENKKQTSLEVTPQQLILSWTELGFFRVKDRQVKINLEKVDWVNSNIDVRKKKNGKTYIHSCAISSGEQEYKFGKDYQLTREDVDLITQEVKSFLKQIRHS